MAIPGVMQLAGNLVLHAATQAAAANGHDYILNLRLAATTQTKLPYE